VIDLNTELQSRSLCGDCFAEQGTLPPFRLHFGLLFICLHVLAIRNRAPPATRKVICLVVSLAEFSTRIPHVFQHEIFKGSVDSTN